MKSLQNEVKQDVQDFTYNTNIMANSNREVTGSEF